MEARLKGIARLIRRNLSGIQLQVSCSLAPLDIERNTELAQCWLKQSYSSSNHLFPLHHWATRCLVTRAFPWSPGCLSWRYYLNLWFPSTILLLKLLKSWLNRHFCLQSNLPEQPQPQEQLLHKNKHEECCQYSNAGHSSCLRSCRSRLLHTQFIANAEDIVNAIRMDKNLKNSEDAHGRAANKGDTYRCRSHLSQPFFTPLRLVDGFGISRFLPLF